MHLEIESSRSVVKLKTPTSDQRVNRHSLLLLSPPLIPPQNDEPTKGDATCCCGFPSCKEQHAFTQVPTFVTVWCKSPGRWLV